MKRLESTLRMFGPGFHIYQYLFKTNRPEIPFARYGDDVIDAAIDQRRQFFDEKRERLYRIEIFYAIVLEGQRSKTGIMAALKRLPTDPRGAAGELKAQLTGHGMKVLLRNQIDADASKLQSHVENFVHQLSDFMRIETLGQQDQFTFFRRLLNFDDWRIAGKPKATQFLDYQVVNSDVAAERDHLRIGDHYVRLFTMKEAIGETRPMVLDRLLKIDANFHVVTEWTPLSTAKAKKEVTARRRHFNMAKSGFFSQMREEKRPERDQLIDESKQADIEQLGDCLRALGDGQSMGEFSLSIVLNSTDLDTITREIGAFANIFTNADGALFTETYNQLNALFATVPGNYAHNLRKLYLLNSNYADLSFLFTIHPGERTNAHLGTEYLAVMETDNATPYYLNLHNGEVAHTLITGMTGSGKTYVYLRTIYELAERYGWLKFIIVVPSVAIREGVKENLRITAEHFRALYHQTARVQVYEGRRVQELKEFAQSNTLQIMVINIDAFNKNFGPDAERKNNVIFKEQEGFENATPIETVQAAQPIVILDEPQSIDSTERAQEAIKALRPLFTLRYSATHKNPYNVVYRLGPIEAFEQRLVKQIVVDSAVVEGAGAQAFVHVQSIDNKAGLKAKVQIHVQGKGGPRAAAVTVKGRDNLFHLSKERAAYKEGFGVREISVGPGEPFIEFVNGLRLGIGQQHGGVRDDVQAAQIRRTVKHHLEKELVVQRLGVKVLSLFFVDRVANYREYGTNGPSPGRFAMFVEEALREFAKDSRYAALEWLQLPAGKLHDGYFAKDKKSGAIKDANGSTADDSTAYELIMQKKEELLSLAMPLRFIFSHSALREGWDNPNVFQICTLNERQSTMTKRQEIGRGLRLPVNQEGVRVRDDSVNRLYVVANESYDEFARGLQANYAEDGVHFGRVSKRAFTGLMLGEGEDAKPMGTAASQALWKALQDQGILSEQGDLRPGVDVYGAQFQVDLPEEFAGLGNEVIDLLRTHRIERHVQDNKRMQPNPRREEQMDSPEFKELWSRISARTRYRVEFNTDDLVRKAVQAIKRLPEIRPVELRFTTAATTLKKAGVAATPESQSHQEIRYKGPLPDLLAYLQAQTDLTRSTLQRVLKISGRLEEFLINPQEFMDATVGALRTAMLELLIDGIQYERMAGTEHDHVWQQEQIFEKQTNIDILAAVRVSNSIYEWVPVDSKVEQVFAEGLNQRHLTFRLFVKLPRAFTVRIPIGEYQPDWAIVKLEDDMVYLIRETKGSRNYQKLRISEAYKVRCGQKHFKALGVSFEVVEKVEEV